MSASMTFYILKYDTDTGSIQSVSSVLWSTSGSSSDLTYSKWKANVQPRYASRGQYPTYKLPKPYDSSFAVSRFRADLDRLNDNDLPIYVIDRQTGMAYLDSGTTAGSAYNVDPDPEYQTASSSSEDDVEVENRGISIGDVNIVSNGVTVGDTGSGSDEDTGETEEDESGNTTITVEDAETYTETVEDHLSGISAGEFVLCNIVLSADSDKWLLDTETGFYTRTIENDNFTQSTVLSVLGINRKALNAHLYWETGEEWLTFRTKTRPSEKVILNCVLYETGDEWNAKGVIEAWPGAGITSKRFRQSLNAGVDNWSLTLGARGSGSDVVAISTKVQFGNAQLISATPEWTGNNAVMIPHIWVDTTANGNVLCYTLSNTSDAEVQITDVSLRLLYLGNLSGLVEDTEDDAVITPYITAEDIDLLN